MVNCIILSVNRKFTAIGADNYTLSRAVADIIYVSNAVVFTCVKTNFEIVYSSGSPTVSGINRIGLGFGHCIANLPQLVAGRFFSFAVGNVFHTSVTLFINETIVYAVP